MKSWQIILTEKVYIQILMRWSVQISNILMKWNQLILEIDCVFDEELLAKRKDNQFLLLFNNQNKELI